MTGDLPAFALRAAVFGAVRDRIVEVYGDARAALTDAFTTTGADSTTATLPDGTKVAKVSLVGADRKPKLVVEDELAFFRWVAEHHPTEIERRVRPAFRDHLLDQVGRTGELPDGVGLSPAGEPYVSVRFAPGGRDAIRRAWAAGQLAHVDPLALPAAEDGAA